MEKIVFNNFKEVLKEIKNRNYDRNFASVIGFEFAFEENDKLIYNNLDDYDFFFHFLDIEQSDLTNEKFISIINKLLHLKELNSINIKKILYEEQLDKIEEKYNNNFITQEVYDKLKNKYLK